MTRSVEQPRLDFFPLFEFFEREIKKRRAERREIEERKCSTCSCFSKFTCSSFCHGKEAGFG